MYSRQADSDFTPPVNAILANSANSNPAYGKFPPSLSTFFMGVKKVELPRYTAGLYFDWVRLTL